MMYEYPPEYTNECYHGCTHQRCTEVTHTKHRGCTPECAIDVPTQEVDDDED